MRFQGGKSKIAKHIAAVINAQPGDVYVEPFVGGASVLALVDKPVRLASDCHPELIAMWQGASDPPGRVSQ